MTASEILNLLQPHADNETTPELMRQVNETTLADLEQCVHEPVGIVPFAEAGMSKDFGFPLWGNLLESLARDGAGREKMLARLSAGQYEEAAQDLSEWLGGTLGIMDWQLEATDSESLFSREKKDAASWDRHAGGSDTISDRMYSPDCNHTALHCRSGMTPHFGYHA